MASNAVAAAFDITPLSFVAASERFTAVGRLKGQITDEEYNQLLLNNCQETNDHKFISLINNQKTRNCHYQAMHQIHQYKIPSNKIVQFAVKERRCIIRCPNKTL